MRPAVLLALSAALLGAAALAPAGDEHVVFAVGEDVVVVRGNAGHVELPRALLPPEVLPGDVIAADGRTRAESRRAVLQRRAVLARAAGEEPW